MYALHFEFPAEQMCQQARRSLHNNCKHTLPLSFYQRPCAILCHPVPAHTHCQHA